METQQKVFTDEEIETFIFKADTDLCIGTWEEFCPAIPDEEIPFETFYVNYQEKHLLKYGNYLTI